MEDKAFIVKITNHENIDKILHGLIFSHIDIYNFENDIQIGDLVFIYFGGDKSVISWEQGLAGYGKIVKKPYDKGYDSKKPRNFKIDIEPIKILPHSIPPKKTKIHKIFSEIFYDIPYVGANHFPNQAIAKFTGEDKVDALKGIIENKGLINTPHKKVKALSNNLIQKSFVKWCFEEPNYRKSYDGLVTVEVLNFWNDAYFDNSLFLIDEKDIEGSIEKQRELVKNPSNKDWFKYSKATSRGAPEAILGNNNYIKFLSEFFSNSKNIKEYIGNQSNTAKPKTSEPFTYKTFLDNLQKAKLILSKNLADRFICSLQTKPFVILTGLSGSGKTKLAEAFSLWISASNNQYCMVAVGADWTNRDPLLGFPNALEIGKYVKPDSGVLDLILQAQKDINRPYFLILDEMNMSHVERYFADFLSAMESTDRTIKLRPDTTDWDDCDVQASITLPDNLFIIGTVNIDETTYMFSPKVLDRANVIEFRVSENNMKDYLEKPNGLDMNSLRGAGSSMGESFVAKTREQDIITDNLSNDLMIFFNKLQEVGAEFGYRTASEISRFIAICEDMSTSEMSRDEIIDAAIMQKLLPKLHGSRNKIEKILKALGSLCLEDTSNPAFLLNDDKSDKHPVKYPLSYEKLNRMHTRVLSDGFTSFAEA